MPNSYRIVTQIQDQDDFAGSLTNDYYLKYSSGTGKFSLQPLSVSPGGSDGQVQYNNAGSFGGAALVTYATSGTILTAAAGATTDVPFAVNGAASHSGNLQQWKVNGTTKAYITADGAITAAGAVNFRIDPNNGFINTYGTGWNGLTLSSNPGNTLVLSGGGNPNILTTASSAVVTPIAIRGTTSQTATLIQLQGRSSTTAGTAQAEIDTAWVDSTHATRKARLLLRVYDTAVREGLRIDADGTYALTAIGGGTVTASTALTVTSPTATYIGQIVKGASSQSANLQEWQNSSGTVVGAIGLATSSTAYGAFTSHVGTPKLSSSMNADPGNYFISLGTLMEHRIYQIAAGDQGWKFNAIVGSNSTSGQVYGLRILPIYNQSSGTAANTDFLVNRTETAVGSGAQILLDLQVGSTSCFNVSNKSVVFIANAGTVPATDPTGGGVLYCEGGALKFRGSSGTVTTVAPA